MLIEVDDHIPIVEFARAMIGIGCEIRSADILIDEATAVTLRVSKIRIRKTTKTEDT